MFAVFEAKNASGHSIRCKEIFSLQEKSEESLINEASRSAVVYRTACLLYEDQIQKQEIREAISGTLTDIEALSSKYFEDRMGEIERVLEKTRAAERIHAEKTFAFRENMRSGFRKLHSDFKARLHNLRAEDNGHLSKVEKDLDLRMRIQIMRTEEDRNLHFHILRQAQERSLKEFKDYYDSVLKECEDKIERVETEVSRTTVIKNANAEEIRMLSEENSRASSPMENLERSKLRLLEEMEIAKGGRMAFSNFRKSVNELESEIDILQKHIRSQLSYPLTESSY